MDTSNFRLVVELPEGAAHPDNTVLDIIDDLRENNETASYALNEDGTTRDEAAWPEVDTDMCEFSKKYPGVVLVLSSESGNPEDFAYGIFETRFSNGQIIDVVE